MADVLLQPDGRLLPAGGIRLKPDAGWRRDVGLQPDVTGRRAR